MYNYYPQQQPSYVYGQARPKAANTQPLTQEQINQLKAKSAVFDMKVSQEDMWRAYCTHREKNGNSALIRLDDSHYECAICHEQFSGRMEDQSVIDDATNKIVSILQLIKMMYLDIPEDLVIKFFQIIPLIKKIPGLYQVAISNYNRYTSVDPNNSVVQGNDGGNTFTTLYNMFNPNAAFNMPNGGSMYYQQPTWNPANNYYVPGQQTQTYYPNNTVPANGYVNNQQQPVVGNPLGYNMPVQQPVQQAPQVGVQPGTVPVTVPQQQPQTTVPQPTTPQPAAPQQGEVVTTKSYTV